MKFLSFMIVLVCFFAVSESFAGEVEHLKFLPKKIEGLMDKGLFISKEETANISKWIDFFEKGDLWEKQVALDGLWFLKHSKYITDPAMFDPILKGLKDKDPAVRTATAAYFKYLGENAIGSYQGANIVPRLIEALKDDSPETRKESAKALAYFKDKSALEPLIELLQDEDPWIKLDVVFALGELGDRQTILPLLDLFSNDSDFSNKFVQQEALITIRKLMKRIPYVRNPDGSFSTIQGFGKDFKATLLPVLTNKFNDPYLKADIIKFIGKSNIIGAEKLLILSLHDSNDNIRNLALEALISISDTKDGKTAKDLLSVDILKELLKDTSPMVRTTSVHALGKSRNEKAVDPLIEALKDSDSKVQLEAINSLGSFKQETILDELVPFFGKSNLSKAAKNTFLKIVYLTHQGYVYYFRKQGTLSVVNRQIQSGYYSDRILHPHAVKILIRELESSDPEILKAVLDLIRRFHSESFVLPLTRLLDDTSADIRRLALSRIYAFSGLKALPYIIDALDDEDVEIREAAVEMLGNFKAENALEPLLKSLNDPEWSVRRSAALSLGQIKDNTSINPLIGLLSDGLYPVRVAALQSLGEFDAPRISDANTRMLGDPSSYVREAAIENIIKAPDESAVGPLILLLKDNSNSNNNAPRAAAALGAIRDKDAVDALIEALSDERKSRYLLRINAAFALARIGDKRAIPYLENALNDKSIAISVKKALKYFGDPDLTLKALKNSGNSTSFVMSFSSILRKRALKQGFHEYIKLERAIDLKQPRDASGDGPG